MEYQGQMELPLFKKIVDECARHGVYSVRLSWRGEPLTHPDIKEMIRYSTERIENVSFLTNAYYLFDDMIDLLIDSQIAYISVSFDGLKEIYNQIRRPAIFEESFQKLKRLQERKKEKGSKRPQLRVCTIWPAVRDNPDEYQEVMSKVSDYLVYNNYKNFKAKPNPVPDFVCQYPWERIMIAWDGEAQCCTGWNSQDIALGNLSEKSVYEMWHSDKMDYIRKMHKGNRRLEIYGCSICRHGNVLPDQNIDVQEIIKRGY
jgi:radical SAM protein with 4Fe4S-binding SPASM domain